MEILSDKELQRLNRDMLGLGRPDEKDDVGYNKPDWNRMEALGRYTGELTNEMRFAIADGLAHYRNTQLSGVKDELEYTLSHYKELCGREKPYSFNMERISGRKEDFVSRQIHFVHENSENLYVKFDGNVYLYNFAPYWKDYGWTDKSYSILRIAKNRVEDFMERLKDYGDYGYEPDEELAKIVARITGQKAVEMQKTEAEPIKKDTLFVVKKEEGSTYIVFEGFADIRDFMNEENEEYGNVLSWAKVDGKFAVKVADDELPYLYRKATELGFASRELKERFSGFKYLTGAERRAEMRRKAVEERNEKNKSGIGLVDVDSLPLPFKPYDFQVQDAKEIVNHKTMLIGHDMGCGKTFIASLVGTSIDAPKIVICPESLRINWRKEIRNVTPDADIRVLYSKDKFDITKDSKPDWVVVGYSTVAKYGEQLSEFAKETGACVFIDEAHNGKAINNSGKPASKRADAILNICSNAEYVYPMTGTPIPTRNKDLFNIFKMLKVEEIDGIKLNEKWGFFNYGKQFCNGYNNGYGWNFDGNSKSRVLHDELQNLMVRRLKKDVLPNLTKQRIFIPTETESREYKKVEKQLENMNDEDTYMALAMHGRAVLSKDKVNIATDLADSMLAEDKSVVIVSNFNETLDKVVEKYGDDCCTIRGGMSDVAKQKAIDDFQSGKKRVCALNIIAGGVGVTLTKAHDMIICDYDWTPSNMSQVEDRICRAGQTEGCNIHYIYCENAVLDQIFVNMITGKSENIDRVVDGVENTMDLNSGVSYMQQLKKKYPIKNKEKDEGMKTIGKDDVKTEPKPKEKPEIKW